MAAPIRTQVVNGLRLAGIGFAAFAVILVLFDGFERIASQSDSIGGWAKTAAGVAELFVAGIGLLLTTNLWAKWVTTFAIFVGLKSVIGFVAGTAVSLPFRPVSRVVAAETILYLAAVGILSDKFSSRAPKMPEKIGLVIVVFTTCADMLFEPQPLALALGVAALLVTRVGTAIALKSRNHDPGGPVAVRHR
jgi:hypothetical protein